MKPLLTALTLITLMVCGSAYAEPAHTEGSFREKMKNMSPEERQAFQEKRKERWNAMSKEEKLKEIESKRAERLEKMQEKWNNMSDDEKISHIERKMERKMGGKSRCPHSGDDMPPPPGE